MSSQPNGDSNTTPESTPTYLSDSNAAQALRHTLRFVYIFLGIGLIVAIVIANLFFGAPLVSTILFCLAAVSLTVYVCGFPTISIWHANLHIPVNASEIDRGPKLNRYYNIHGYSLMAAIVLAVAGAILAAFLG